MKYFKNRDTGEVFAFESDGSQDAFIPQGLVEMTSKEVSDHLAPPVLTEEQLSVNAGQERDSRLGIAQLRIAPLQYAVNLEMATDLEKDTLLAWMRYSVSLNRIEQQPGYPSTIEWPSPPGVTAMP